MITIIIISCIFNAVLIVGITLYLIRQHNIKKICQNQIAEQLGKLSHMVDSLTNDFFTFRGVINKRYEYIDTNLS